MQPTVKTSEKSSLSVQLDGGLLFSQDTKIKMKGPIKIYTHFVSFATIIRILQNFILKFVEITLRLDKGMNQTLLTKSLLAMNLFMLQSLAKNFQSILLSNENDL